MLPYLPASLTRTLLTKYGVRGQPDEQTPMLLYLMNRDDVWKDKRNTARLLHIIQLVVPLLDQSDLLHQIGRALVPIIHYLLYEDTQLSDPVLGLACDSLRRCFDPTPIGSVLPSSLCIMLNERQVLGQKVSDSSPTDSLSAEIANWNSLSNELDVPILATWDFYDKTGIWTLKPNVKYANATEHVSSLSRLAVHPWLGRFATLSKDRVQIWSHTLLERTCVCTASGASLVDVTWANEAERIATAAGSSVMLWDIGSGVSINARRFDSLDESSHFSAILNHEQSYAAHSFLLGGDNRGSLQMLDFRSDRPVLRWNLRDQHQHTGGDVVKRICADPTGLMVGAGLSSGQIVVLDIRMGSILHSWRTTDEPVLELLFFSSNAMIASHEHGNIKIWDLQSNRVYGGTPPRLTQRIMTNGIPISSIAVHGSEIVCGAGSKVGLAKIGAVERSDVEGMQRVPLSGQRSRSHLSAVGILNDSGVFVAGRQDGSVIVTG